MNVIPSQGTIDPQQCVLFTWQFTPKQEKQYQVTAIITAVFNVAGGEGGGGGDTTHSKARSALRLFGEGTRGELKVKLSSAVHATCML